MPSDESLVNAINNRAVEIGYNGWVDLTLMKQGAVWMVVDGMEVAKHVEYLAPSLPASVLQPFLS